MGFVGHGEILDCVLKAKKSYWEILREWQVWRRPVMGREFWWLRRRLCRGQRRLWSLGRLLRTRDLGLMWDDEPGKRWCRGPRPRSSLRGGLTISPRGFRELRGGGEFTGKGNFKRGSKYGGGNQGFGRFGTGGFWGLSVYLSFVYMGLRLSIVAWTKERGLRVRDV